jgi:hypothetical protein
MLAASRQPLSRPPGCDHASAPRPRGPPARAGRPASGPGPRRLPAMRARRPPPSDGGELARAITTHYDSRIVGRNGVITTNYVQEQLADAQAGPGLARARPGQSGECSADAAQPPRRRRRRAGRGNRARVVLRGRAVPGATERADSLGAVGGPRGEAPHRAPRRPCGLGRRLHPPEAEGPGTGGQAGAGPGRGPDGGSY